ncbi:MAG: phosphatidate cytidylyltransferase [Candidatus Gracilibacteria bacterium]|nr:phosphatidate cytidylyltransferase [Candidatus Gracilibacteria bacterium]
MSTNDLFLALVLIQLFLFYGLFKIGHYQLKGEKIENSLKQKLLKTLYFFGLIVIVSTPAILLFYKDGNNIISTTIEVTGVAFIVVIVVELIDALTHSIFKRSMGCTSDKKYRIQTLVTLALCLFAFFSFYVAMPALPVITLIVVLLIAISMDTSMNLVGYYMVKKIPYETIKMRYPAWISPKKTFLSVLISTIIIIISCILFFENVSIVIVLLSIVGTVVGDCIFSMYKRYVGKDDFLQTLGPIGGLLDRVNGWIVALLLVYLFV